MEEKRDNFLFPDRIYLNNSLFSLQQTGGDHSELPKGINLKNSLCSLQQAANLVSPCSATAKWPTVHSSHGASCGKRNTTTAERHLSVSRVLFSCLPMLPFRRCHRVSCSWARVCVRACVRWWTTVYELALLFSLVQFHLKLSSVRLLARSANINSSSTATTHTRRRPHNTFATVVRRCFCFLVLFCWYSRLRYIKISRVAIKFARAKLHLKKEKNQIKLNIKIKYKQQKYKTFCRVYIVFVSLSLTV